MKASNPRDVAYIFRDNLRSIHARARANDPSFVKIAVLAGRVSFDESPLCDELTLLLSSLAFSSAQVEQWTESRYPSYIQIGQPAPKTSDEWQEGMDARIKQLKGLAPDEILRRDRALRTEGHKMSYEDVSDACVLKESKS